MRGLNQKSTVYSVHFSISGSLKKKHCINIHVDGTAIDASTVDTYPCTNICTNLPDFLINFCASRNVISSVYTLLILVIISFILIPAL